MLVKEVAADVIGCLDRQNLDATEITTKTLNNVVTAFHDGYPLRTVQSLTLCNGGLVRFVSDRGVEITAALESLGHLLRRMLVREVRFECQLSGALYKALLPRMEKFKDSVCNAPTTYESQALLERAFSELLFCRVLRIKALGVKGVNENWAYNAEAPFVSLPCIQMCELLRICDVKKPPEEFGDKFFRWLYGGGEKKKLALEVDFSELSFILQTNFHVGNFEASTAASSYELTYVTTKRVVLPSYMRNVNEGTQEELIRESEASDVGGKVTFTRRPLISGN